jgi:antigen flippase
LILGLLTLPTYNLTTLFINVFAAAQKFRESSLLAVIINAATMLAGVTGVVLAGVMGLYIGNLLIGALLTVVVMIYFRRKLELPLYDHRTNIGKEFKQSPDVFLLAIMLYFGAIAASLAFLVARYSVLKNFGEAEAGLLHGVIALSLALGMALNPAINLYLTPLINRNVEKSVKIQQTVQFQRKMTLILSLAVLPVLMFPQLMLTIMFSTKFTGVSQLVFLFVMSQFILQLAGSHQALLIGVGDVKIYTVITTLDN